MDGLLRAIDAYTGNVIVRAVLRIAPHVLVRPVGFRRVEWAEFNLDVEEWRIPAAHMKMRELHIVPLARQVKEILAELHQYIGGGGYLLPSMKANTATISV